MSGPSQEGIHIIEHILLRYPDFRIVLLVTAFPAFKPVADIVTFVPGYSGWAVPEFHRLPYPIRDSLKIPEFALKVKNFLKILFRGEKMPKN